MRAILNKEAREEFLSTNWKFSTMAFKWSKSGVCRLYDRRNDQTKFYAGGYGYDKKGTVLGEFINTYFAEELKKLDSSKFYGLSHYNKNAKSSKRRFLKYASKRIDEALTSFSQSETFYSKNDELYDAWAYAFYLKKN